MSKRIVVLGLGSFGAALALRLSKNGCRVTGMDRSERNVEMLRDQLYEAVVADATDRQVLEQLLLDKADAVCISLGESIERSILTALHAKELRARQILAKAISEEHGRVLKKIGVDRVIFPEVEMAELVADRVTWPNVLETLQIDPDYSIMEIAVPPSFAGRTLQEIGIRRRYGILVITVKDVLTGKVQEVPHADFQLSENQLLIVYGKMEDLNRFREIE
jgi:trk system potassium uptake protein TrkA